MSKNADENAPEVSRLPNTSSTSFHLKGIDGTLLRFSTTDGTLKRRRFQWCSKPSPSHTPTATPTATPTPSTSSTPTSTPSLAPTPLADIVETLACPITQSTSIVLNAARRSYFFQAHFHFSYSGVKRSELHQQRHRHRPRGFGPRLARLGRCPATSCTDGGCPCTSDTPNCFNLALWRPFNAVYRANR